jgi:hypothetical protein
MSYMNALWLVLVHLGGAAAIGSRAEQRSLAVYGIEVTQQADSSWNRSNESPTQLFRASYVDATTFAPRAASRIPVRTPTLLSDVELSGRASLARLSREVIGQLGIHVYRVDARGSLLPYDPTAPPHQV